MDHRLFVPSSIIIGSLIIAGSIMSAGGIKAPSTASQTSAPPRPDSALIAIGDSPYTGDADAPVTIAYWSDYQCPFCKMFEEQSLSKIVDEYVADGKVRIIFKDLQFLGPDSQALGRVARAVWETAPSKYYAWHRAIITNQGQEHSEWATDEFIARISTPVLGAADTARAMSLSKSKADVYQALMDADRTEASGMGITSTPTSLIGQTMVVGARPYTEVKATIEEALSGI